MRWADDHRKKKSVSVWVSVVVIMVILAVAITYILLPADNLKETLGIENAKEVIYSRNSWGNLTPFQQEMLAPLEKDWNKFNSAQKKKWLEIARKMQGMSLEEKERLQTHIKDWLSLTPEQRRLARQNFLGFKKLNSQVKSQQWREYQNLPEEKKRALAAKAKSKSNLANLNKELPQSKVVEPIKQSEKKQNNQIPLEEEPDYWN